jgi:hypothetical protein
MSAGNVKFIGWTGTNPSYQELEPSISYEPFRQFQRSTSAVGNVEIGQYVRAKVTRTLIVFSKDKDTFIGGLGYSNNTLNLTYVDSDGSIKTKNYGNGWEILSLDESPAAKGFTKIRLTYEKAIAKSLAFSGVDGLSVDCVDGVCRIRYKNNNLETIDSGTGTCTTGLNFQIDRYSQAALPANITEDSRLESLSSTVFSVSAFCNGVLFDTVEVTGGDLPLQPIEKTVETIRLPPSIFPATRFPTYNAAKAAFDIFVDINKWDSEKTIGTEQPIIEQYPSTQNINYTITFSEKPNFTIYGIDTVLANRFEAFGSIAREITVKQTTTLPAVVPLGSAQLSWSKTGNILALKLTGAAFVPTRPIAVGKRVDYVPVRFWSKTIREYDVTGL